jgi:hypothetical protein
MMGKTITVALSAEPFGWLEQAIANQRDLDPYLERYWEDLHPALIVHALESLQRRLPDDLIAPIERRVFLEAGGGRLRHTPPAGSHRSGIGGARPSTAIRDRHRDRREEQFDGSVMRVSG